MATAAAEASAPTEHMPFVELSMPPSPVEGVPIRSKEFEKLWSVKFDPDKPIVLPDLKEKKRGHMRLSNAIRGEADEIIAILEACLKMGRIERAALIIKRSEYFLELGPDAAGRLHTEFLRASLIQALATPDKKATDKMHLWYEKQVRPKDITTFSETIAILLKASLQDPSKTRRKLLVDRYMAMIPGESALEAFSFDDVLSAEDLTTINEVVPKHPVFEMMKNADDDATAEVAAPEEVNQKTEVTPTSQKGSGLKSLKASLNIFANQPAGFDPSKLTLDEQRLRQAKMEEDAHLAAVDRWREESANLQKMGLDTALQTKSLGARMWRWQQALEKRIREEMISVDLAESKKAEERTESDVEKCQYGPFLRYLSPEKLGAVTILSTMQTLTSYGADRGVPVAGVVVDISKTVEEESLAEQMQETLGPKGYQDFTENVKKKGLNLISVLKNERSRKQVSESLASIIKLNDSPDAKWDHDWPVNVRTKVGAFLLSALFETAKMPVSVRNRNTGEWITQIQPAFSHGQQFKIGKRTGILLANPALVESLRKEPVHSLLCKQLPMLIPPEPWTQFGRGGFITPSAKAVRIKNGDKSQRYYQEAAIEKGDMEQMFKGLEVLGKTPWMINKPVYDVMLEAWNGGEAIASFPPADPKLEPPPEPEQSLDPSERRKWLRTLKGIENTKGAMHSVRCFTNFQLEIARAFRDEKFFFPHNVDFRGRAYPIPPYLNHMGADHCRGLLKFGVGRELGARGLKWLRVHISNLAGFDKASLSEREQFTIDHMDDIRDSVANPLGGKKWWLKAEDPWQCLAGCFEIVAAMDSPDPEKYVSHLPVHQDGTCNGLQHYAALGGDSWGAAQVNLEPGDRPADVYSAVADLVKADIAEDIKKGDIRAKFLDGKISRKVVKQTVMTNVYGVTFVGAQAQVKKQLMAAYPDIPLSDHELSASVLASYVARHIFKALGTMFKGAHDIQYWLGECASRITSSLTVEQIENMDRLAHRQVDIAKGKKLNKHEKSRLSPEDQYLFKSSVVWTSPLRMPIVQPYRASKARCVHTNLQRINITEPGGNDPVAKRKQLQGFPPNFIHSLDATHMMLSAIKCDELGLTFAAVHDSFWTHAADVDSMNTVLRDAFIQMHSEDIIGRLKQEFETRYKGSFYLATIKADTEYFSKVKQWRKDVNSGKIDNPYRKLFFESLGAEPKKKTLHARTTNMYLHRQQLMEVLMERLRARLLGSNDPKEVEQGKAMVTPVSILEDMRRENGGKVVVFIEDEVEVAGLGDLKSPKNPLRRINSDKGKTDVDEIENDVGDAIESFSEDMEASDSEVEVPVEEDVDEKEAVEQPKRTMIGREAVKGTQSFEKALNSKQSFSGTNRRWVWLPLEFPKVPEKVC